MDLWTLRGEGVMGRLLLKLYEDYCSCRHILARCKAVSSQRSMYLQYGCIDQIIPFSTHVAQQ